MFGYDGVHTKSSNRKNQSDRLLRNRNVSACAFADEFGIEKTYQATNLIKE